MLNSSRKWLLVVLLVVFQPAHAGINNPGSGTASAGPVGKAQINLGAGDTNAQQLINLLNATTQYSFSGGATPAVTDADGYPIANFTGLISGGLGFIDKTMSTTGPWIFSWPAGRSSFRIIFAQGATLSSAVNCTFINGAGTGQPTITGDGVHAGSVTINWNSTSGTTFEFDGTYTGWGSNTSGVMSLVRSTDVTAFNAGEFWTPEFISIIKNLHPHAIRPMSWNLPRSGAVDTNWTTWAYRKKTTALSFWETNANYPPGARAGGISSWGTIAVTNGAYTAPAAADTPLSGWVNGEQLIGNNASATGVMTVTGAAAKTGTNAGDVQLSVASTTGLVASNPVLIAGVNGTTEANGRHTILSVDGPTTFTINVTFVNAFATSAASAVGYQTLAITGKSGGAKLILNNLANPIGFGFTSDQNSILSGNATYFYDQVMDAVIYTSDGISNTVPIEAQVQLANRVNANLWWNAPTWALDDLITQTANTAFGLLNSNLKFEVEWSNEVWNSGQNANFSSQAKGALLFTGGGWPDWQALRNRQINGTILPATSWGAAMSRLDRLYMFQAGTGFGDTSITNAMSGNDLAPTGTHTGTGTSLYTTLYGGPDYTQSPNRPIDFTDAIGYAPYMAGSGLGGQSPDAFAAPVALDAPTLQSIATNFNAGGSGITTAIALIDGAIRQDRAGVQNVTASGTTFTTPLAHGFTAFPSANYNLLRFDVSGGTAYSGLNLQTLYVVTSTPTSNTFTAAPIVAGAKGSDVNAGTAGSGTTTVGSAGISSSGITGPASIFMLQSGTYTKWEAMAATYDASRPAAGLPNLKMEWYEGALEPTAPTTAQCTTLGINLSGSAANASAAIASAIVAWKNDASSSATIQLYYSTFMGLTVGYVTSGAMPHSLSTSQLVLNGGGVYALTANTSLQSPGLYQTYNGFAAFSAP